MSRFTIQSVWQNITTELATEIVQFWISNQAIGSEAEALKRVSQVALTARDTNNNLVAISSVYEQYHEQLHNHLYYIRAFVAEPARRSTLATELLHKLKTDFESQYKAEENTRAIGLYMEIENKMIQQARNEAIWPATQFVYIGKNRRGHHQRIYYFDGARIS